MRRRASAILALAGALACGVEPDPSSDTGADAAVQIDTGGGGGGGGGGTLNACGGATPLGHGVGDACCSDNDCQRWCEDGRWVCDGADALRCVDSTARNECGGCGGSDGALGAVCGPCGSTWECDGDALFCPPAERNACGGCVELPVQPGFGCYDGIYTCSGPNEVVCRSSGGNGCGGLTPLDPAPGASCGTCNLGRWVCDGTDATECVDADLGVNACGGCGTLRGLPGTGCGCGGTWTCDGSDVVCEGAAEPNRCGGCEPLDALECAGSVVCETADSLGCGAEGANTCGGSVALVAEPGETCGDCEGGVVVCETPDSVTCAGEAARNACGTCGVLPGRPGDVCGTERRWECRAGRLVCDAAPDRNRCGGESRLASDPGASCGDCGGVTVCVSREETACVGARPRNECGGCASLTVAGVPFADTPGAPCGLCDTGTYECTSAEEVACLGEDLDALRLFYADRDADEWGSTTETRLSCTPLFGYTRVTGDCADLSFERHPEAPELCNGFDDDCDGVVDEGYLSYADGDGDGYSSGTDPQTDCVVPEGRTRLLGDCDDTDDRAFPGQTIAFETERNSGGFDFDCDGVVTLSWDNLSSCTVQLPPCADLGEEATPVPRRGWTSRVPECGRAANYSQTCVDFGAGCVPGEIVVRTQTCL